ncbi:MAG: hypothetical protein JKY65_30125 [Planctomycetes bacterium]|nr:hypothetical protein [Planctomycetota bacterium]
MIALEPAPAPAVATASPTRSRSAPLPSPSPTALPETPFDLEDASEEALGQLGKSGNTAAAAILARRAIGRWDHDRARLWIPLAGSEHSLLTARAKQADLDERDAIRGPRLLLRQLQPREALTQLQLLLERHPRGPKLRTQEAKALLWLGRSRAAISALDKGATGPQAMEIRGVANENLQAGLEDTSARATLHSAWDCYRGGGWTWDKSRRTIRARGVGLGPFGLCGLLDRASERQEGAFKSSVEVRLERDQPGKYGGLLLLKDAGTGLLVYLYYAPESIPPEYAERVAKFPPGEVTMLRVAYLYREEWQPFAEDQAFAHNPTGWHSLEVSYEGSQIQVTVDGVKGEPIQLHGLASGRAGVLKWYDHTLEFRNFKTGP